MRLFIFLFILLRILTVQAKDVIYLGDSLSANDSFGKRIYELINQSYTIEFEALCGSSPFWWVKGSVKTGCGYNSNMIWKKSGTSSKIQTLIAKENPHYIVIQQGTNLLTGQLSQASIRSQVQNLLNLIPEDTKCIWIGPPDADDSKISDTKFSNFYSLLKTILKNKCLLIDSWGVEKVTHYPNNQGDGIHFSGKVQDSEEDKWFKHVKSQIDLHFE
jgi:hypothetical protein